VALTGEQVYLSLTTGVDVAPLAVLEMKYDTSKIFEVREDVHDTAILTRNEASSICVTMTV
jgi:hypothetical protein